MKRNKIGLVYLAPWIFGLLVFTIYPFIASLYYSFTDYNMISKPHFVGLANYVQLFTADPDFKTSLIATFEYVFLTVPLQLIFALLIAFVLNFKLKGIGFYRVAYYIPSLLGGNVAIAVLWRLMFNDTGLINQIVNLFGIHSISWFSSTAGAMTVLTILKVWQFGSAMIIFLAALKNVPQELYEAAEMDGASKISTFFKITIPLITPTIFFNLVMQLINGFQEFNGPFLITGGGPLNRTNLISMLIYNDAFKFSKMGYSSAASWVLFIIIMVFTGLLFWSQNKWVFYSDGGNN
ncbi:carbohydrate ABC transporter permease [Lacticaseibacillus jixiensis]|uniref:carbohydrate ABC transporter permease n=1 Tax=Lacticaseibacillus jixiensis TaxID=3231926 RepID=UPI0036F27AA3